MLSQSVGTLQSISWIFVTKRISCKRRFANLPKHIKPCFELTCHWSISCWPDYGSRPDGTVSCPLWMNACPNAPNIKSITNNTHNWKEYTKNKVFAEIPPLAALWDGLPVPHARNPKLRRRHPFLIFNLIWIIISVKNVNVLWNTIIM